MATVKVRNVGPFDRTLPDVGAVVPVGGVVEVSASLAGEAPGKWEPAASIVDDGRLYRAAEKPSEEFPFEARHAGSGLLAQEDSWEIAKVADVKPAAAEKVEG